MSMPGFVFHFVCPSCAKTSKDYPLYVFEDLFGSDICLPAWSRKLHCYATVYCHLAPADRVRLRNNREQLRDFVNDLSSPSFRVGHPLWNLDSVGVEPVPECPYCGSTAQVRYGYPPREDVVLTEQVDKPYEVPLSQLGLSVRAQNCLESLGVNTLGELCELTAQELLAAQGFRDSTLAELREMVKRCGCKLKDD